jgi:hypothetical protein
VYEEGCIDWAQTTFHQHTVTTTTTGLERHVSSLVGKFFSIHCFLFYSNLSTDRPVLDVSATYHHPQELKTRAGRPAITNRRQTRRLGPRWVFSFISSFFFLILTEVDSFDEIRFYWRNTRRIGQGQRKRVQPTPDKGFIFWSNSIDKICDGLGRDNKKGSNRRQTCLRPRLVFFFVFFDTPTKVLLDI